MHRSVFVTSAIIGLSLPLFLVPNRTVVAASKKDQGRQLFSEKGCAQCHGADGVGGGRGPDLQLVRKRKDKDAIAKQIHEGGGAMPAYGDILQPDELQDLVEFLYAKRKQIVPAEHAKPDAPATPKAKDPDGGL